MTARPGRGRTAALHAPVEPPGPPDADQGRGRRDPGDRREDQGRDGVHRGFVPRLQVSAAQGMHALLTITDALGPGFAEAASITQPTSTPAYDLVTTDGEGHEGDAQRCDRRWKY